MDNLAQSAGWARRLSLSAGFLIVALSDLHIIYFGLNTVDHWQRWLAGELRDINSNGVEADAALAGFWALPGGFAVPTLALGLMIIGQARARRQVPIYVGVLLLLWSGLATFIQLFTGFAIAVIPALMLLIARIWPSAPRRGSMV